VDLETAIRSRRTVKEFRPEPVERAVLNEIFELSRWAPNHHLTEPWRYRVLGQASLLRLEGVIGAEAMVKVRRAPTLVVVSCVVDKIPERATEDSLATAASIYALLLAATSRGIASYWRTPGFLRTAAGAAACGITETEHPLGLVYLGYSHSGQSVAPPSRQPIEAFVEYLS
jgi:nitroreductase